jgi:hypothetical protein
MRIGALVFVGVALAAGLSYLACSPGDEGNSPAPGPRGDYRFGNPVLNAKPGEWAHYVEFGSRKLELEVLRNDPGRRAVEIRTTVRGPRGAIIDPPAPAWKPYNFFLWGYSKKEDALSNQFDGPGWVLQEVFEDRITVAGRDWDCLAVRFMSPMHGPVVQWYSQEVPVLGMLKMVRTRLGKEEVQLELENWGWVTEKGRGPMPEDELGRVRDADGSGPSEKGGK